MGGVIAHRGNCRACGMRRDTLVGMLCKQCRDLSKRGLITLHCTFGVHDECAGVPRRGRLARYTIVCQCKCHRDKLRDEATLRKFLKQEEKKRKQGENLDYDPN